MEAATKKGRPPIFKDSFYQEFPDKEKRTAQNFFYASITIRSLLKQHPGDFFITERGKFRRRGIAEKIGRLYIAGKLTDKQAKELAETAIERYNNGLSVKEIEKEIAAFARSYL